MFIFFTNKFALFKVIYNKITFLETNNSQFTTTEWRRSYDLKLTRKKK